MKAWLVEHLESGDLDGLTWVDEQNGVFKVKWCHGSRQGWTKKDMAVFEQWAKHTGGYIVKKEIGFEESGVFINYYFSIIKVIINQCVIVFFFLISQPKNMLCVLSKNRFKVMVLFNTQKQLLKLMD